MDDEQRAEQRFRSRGEVAIICSGMPQVAATIQDISVSGLGLLAERAVAAGASVRVEIHGYSAEGVVRYCRAAGGLFSIGIILGGIPQK